jgi:hypothetical protein
MDLILRGARGVEGVLVPYRDKGVQPRVQGVDAVQRFAGDLDGRDLPTFDEGRELVDRHPGEVAHAGNGNRYTWPAEPLIR